MTVFSAPGDPAAFDGWGADAHHDGSELFVLTPAPAAGSQVILRVRVEHRLAASAVHLRTTVDGGQRFFSCAPVQHPFDDGCDAAAGESWWEVRLPMHNQRLGYRFVISTPSGAVWLNAAGLRSHEVTDAADFVLTTAQPPPTWAATAVFYEVFLDRFARSGRLEDLIFPPWAVPAQWGDHAIAGEPRAVRQLFRGDLWGVVQHLDHLCDLGVTTLYLTPFFPSTSNHRYDATTFDKVDPLLGGDAALEALTEAAHQRGLRVIGDLTLNHTGDQHDWFTSARTDATSPEAGFYLFRDHPDSYEAFDDVPSLPKLDHRSPELRRRLFEGSESVAGRYVRKLGLDGWRIDVAQSAGYAGASDRTLTSARALRDTVADTDALVIAEHQFDASSALQGDAWHGTMAYAAFTRPVWSWLVPDGIDRFWGVPADNARYTGATMAACMDAFTARIPWSARVHSMNLLDSHDTPRLRSLLDRDRFLLAVGMMLTMPGLPMVFAGDEIGTQGGSVEAGRQPFQWDRRQWDEEVYAHYRRLLALRAEHPALVRGGFRWLRTDDDVVVYERASRTETLIVQASRSTHAPVFCPTGATAILAEHDVPSAGGLLPHTGTRLRIWSTHPAAARPPG